MNSRRHPKKFRLILASQSPRRREILKGAGIDCMTIPANSSESFDENLTLEENLMAVTETKVQTVAQRLTHGKLKGKLILGADTVVVLGKMVFGKPKNLSDARRMLGLLSNKTHRVMTCFSIFCPDQNRSITRIITTGVQFRRLSKEDIRWYVSTNEPMDKAGAYAIQGLAQQFVCGVEGDLQNVIGLPLSHVKEELRQQRWNVVITRSSSKRARAHRRR